MGKENGLPCRARFSWVRLLLVCAAILSQVLPVHAQNSSDLERQIASLQSELDQISSSTRKLNDRIRLWNQDKERHNEVAAKVQRSKDRANADLAVIKDRAVRLCLNQDVFVGGEFRCVSAPGQDANVEQFMRDIDQYLANRAAIDSDARQIDVAKKKIESAGLSIQTEQRELKSRRGKLKTQLEALKVQLSNTKEAERAAEEEQRAAAAKADEERMAREEQEVTASGSRPRPSIFDALEFQFPNSEEGLSPTTSLEEIVPMVTVEATEAGYQLVIYGTERWSPKAPGAGVVHAFACIETVLRSGVKEDCYGFYPEDETMVVRGPGVTSSEFTKAPERFANVTSEFRVSIDGRQRSRVLNAMDSWNFKEYRLLDQNCIDLVASIASTIGLKVPNRAVHPTPAGYVSALKRLN